MRERALARLVFVRFGDDPIRATNGSTKLRRPGRTGPTSDGFSKPEQQHQTTFGRYRTQEVAGSSPASSTQRHTCTRADFRRLGVADDIA
jgi:hypothetical protein